MDPRHYNRAAWDRLVAAGNRWTIPVNPETIAAARRGEWAVVLTPTRPVPRAWFGELRGRKVLGLASAGGQQCPIFAAAGATVTSFDQSDAQLGRDREVAERERLAIRTVQGDMADLSAFADASFDLIFHPSSNGFVPEIRPVWREAFRVLRPGGVLLAGFVQPVLYVFDEEAEARGELVARHAIPYSDLTSLTRAEVDAKLATGEPLSFGHTLEDQIGGQLDAGFVLTGFYEDRWDGPVNRLIACHAATRAVKPARA
jgi:SAM-dependent methyltransferase